MKHGSGETMHTEKLNRLSGRVVLLLSLLALLTVLSGYTQPRHPAPTDEGAAAHIFQIAVVLVVPALLLFVFTADWKQPSSSAKRLAVPGVLLIAAFTALYFLEHVYFR
jgi:hypothetical protein